jgi:hypothetical protein
VQIGCDRGCKNRRNAGFQAKGRGFESISLQRRVSCEPAFRDQAPKIYQGATARRAPGVSVRTGPLRRVGARIAECRSVCRRVSASPRRPPGHQGGSGRKSRENQRHFVEAVATAVKKKPRLSTGSSSRRRGGRRSAAAVTVAPYSYDSWAVVEATRTGDVPLTSSTPLDVV